MRKNDPDDGDISNNWHQNYTAVRDGPHNYLPHRLNELVREHIRVIDRGTAGPVAAWVLRSDV